MPNLSSTSLWDPNPALELLQHTLARAAHLLCCAQRWAGPNNSDGELRLLHHRLAPDMLALGHQVLVLADGNLGATALLAGVDIGKADFEGDACYTLYDTLPP